MRRSALAIALLVLSGSGSALAAPCGIAAASALQHTTDPLLLLTDLDHLHARADAIDTLADRVFVPVGDVWRSSAALAMGTHFVLGRTGCTVGDRDGDVRVGLTHLGLRARVEQRRWQLTLGVFGVGRLDSALAIETDPGSEQHSLSVGRGLLGVEIQLTRWVRLAWARMGAQASRPSDSVWRAALGRPRTDGPGHLFELGVPALGLRLQFTDAGGELGPREIAARRVPLGGGFSAGAVARVLPVEDGWRVAPVLRHRWDTVPDAWVELGLEAGLGTAHTHLRHVSALLEHVLLAADVTRSSYQRFGARVEQRAEISVHRGPAVRASADADAVLGAWWRALVGLHTPYVHFEFDFGLGINRPDLLDAVPAAANRFALRLGLTLGQRW